MLSQTAKQDAPDQIEAKDTIYRSPQQQRHVPLLLFLLGVAGVCELFYMLLFALVPLPELHMSSTSLTTTLPWTLAPSRMLQSLAGSFFASSYAPTLFASTLVGLIGAYAISMLMVHRTVRTHPTSTCWLFLLLGGALLFGLTLLFLPLLFSDDVWTHIFSGRILSIHGANPLSTAPNRFAGDPFLHWVLSTRDKPNIFGPLFIYIAALLAKISNDPTTSLLLFKGTALLTHLISCVLAWQILGAIAPQRRLSGTLLYAWNPLVLIELAGNGHNEGILLCLFLLATWLYIMSEQQVKRSLILISKMGAYLIFGLAISTNLIALLLAPLLLWFDLRSQQRMAWVALAICGRALIMLIPALLVVLPLWHGATTFLALTSAVDMEHFVYAPVGLLAGPLRALFSVAVQVMQFPLNMLIAPATAANIALRASAAFIFVLIYLRLFSRLRAREQLMPTFDTLLSCWGIAIFWYMVLVSGWFWPWYLLWLLWIVVLQRMDAFTCAMLVLSGTALFIYPFIGFSKNPIATYQVAIIFGIPLIYLIAAKIWQRYRKDVSTYGRRSEAAQD